MTNSGVFASVPTGLNLPPTDAGRTIFLSAIFKQRNDQHQYIKYSLKPVLTKQAFIKGPRSLCQRTKADIKCGREP